MSPGPSRRIGHLTPARRSSPPITSRWPRYGITDAWQPSGECRHALASHRQITGTSAMTAATRSPLWMRRKVGPHRWRPRQPTQERICQTPDESVRLRLWESRFVQHTCNLRATWEPIYAYLSTPVHNSGGGKTPSR